MTDSPHRTADPRSAASRGTVVASFALTVVLALIIDRVSKVLAEQFVSPQGTEFLPGFMELRLVFNKGMSFGLLEGAIALFLAATIVVCAVIVVYLLKYRRHALYEVVGLGLVFAGALGNAFDRVAYGQVTDFLNFQFVNFAVFNVADSCITIGVVLVLVFLIFSRKSPLAGPARAELGEGERADHVS